MNQHTEINDKNKSDSFLEWFAEAQVEVILREVEQEQNQQPDEPTN